jgi:hypothetical protein
MNRKQFVILLVLVVVIGAAGLLVRQRNSDSWHSGGTAIGRKLLPDLPVNDIAQITIKSGADQVSLARQNNLWRVHDRADYPANFSQISEMLLKFADLKVVQNEEVGPSQMARFELLPPGPGSNTAASIDFKDQNGKAVGSLLLGKKHMKKPAANPQFPGMGDEGWPDGRYVMTGGASAGTVALISDPLENVQPKPDQWLNKDFLTVEKPDAIAVQFPEATNSWKLTRASETNDWQLAEAKAGEKLDATKISSVTSPLSSPSFNDVAPLAAGGSGSNTVLTIQTFDGFTYISKIGPKHDDNYPVSFSVTASLPASRVAASGEKPEDKAKLDKDFQARQKTLADKLAKEQAFTNWVYQMPGYSIDEVLKLRSQLLEEASTNSTAQAQK